MAPDAAWIRGAGLGPRSQCSSRDILLELSKRSPNGHGAATGCEKV